MAVTKQKKHTVVLAITTLCALYDKAGTIPPLNTLLPLFSHWHIAIIRRCHPRVTRQIGSNKFWGGRKKQGGRKKAKQNKHKGETNKQTNTHKHTKEKSKPPLK